MAGKKVMIGFKCDVEIKEKLEHIALAEDRSISYIVNRIVTEALAKEDFDENDKALVLLDYIKKLEFKSYPDFIRQIINNGMYDKIEKDFGMLQAYMIVCEKLGEQPDDSIIESFEPYEG